MFNRKCLTGFDVYIMGEIEAAVFDSDLSNTMLIEMPASLDVTNRTHHEVFWK
jgi:hypothetical protein